MGSEQSRTEEENIREGEILDLEKSIKERNFECEISLMNRLLELQLDAAKEMKEKANYFDTKVSTLEVENMNLKMNVAVMAGKIEKLENEKLLNAEDFEIRIKHLESQSIVSVPTPPQFQETIRVYRSSSSSPQLFPNPRQPGVTVAPFKNDVISKKPASVKTSLPNVQNPLSSPHYTHPLPPELTSLCKANYCDLCQLMIHNTIEASTHYWSRKHFTKLESYLENFYKATPELKPKYESSDTYDRPLPKAVISQCTTKKCGLCNLKIVNVIGAAQDHYHGGLHNGRVTKFLQTNPQYWSEGFITLSNKAKVSPLPQKEANSDSRCMTDVTSTKPNDSNMNLTNKTSTSQLAMTLYYDHPLPLELSTLCKVDWCGLCQLTLQENIMANEHYWGKKHFKVLEDYLENSHKEKSELKPQYKPSDTYSRPLPMAIIKQCTSRKCVLCNLTIAEDAGAVHEHYYGRLHEKQVCKFLQRNPQYWSDGFPTVSLSVNVDFQPISEVAPGSWLTDSSQSLPTEVLNQFRQNNCELCSATLQTESVARSHYKGKRHLSNVEQLQKSPDDVLNTSDEILYHHGDLLSSVDGKEIVTLDENCNELYGGSTVFIGCDVLGEVKESIIQEVFIINHDGVPVFDGDVSRIIDTEETSSNAVGPYTTAKVSELEKFQSRLKDVLSSKMLIGFNLGHKLKALKMDHPEHRTREINQPFQGFKPSMRWILKTSLNISEFQHSKEFEAECAMAVFKKKGSSWECKKKVAEVECRILMPPSASTITTKLHKEKKLKGLGLDSPCVSVVSFRSSDVGSVVKSLLEFLRHVNYGQEIEASELKMIVPSTLELKQEDLASGPFVALYKILLPKSKEKVVGFGGNHDDMVSGVFQCLTLMVKNECCYEGLGSRYDSSDHDEETVAQYGGWSVENFQDEHQKEAEIKCRSCSVFGAENFSLSQLMKEDNERKCTNCISLSKLLCI